ncbi:MAG: hypothetical protein CML16_00505 [Pusillimonas sp.]|jgi:hypothetical protein|nr:hypothetical protein [Pusillimonas sp.]MBL4537317.1 hypothetical protein [Oceanicaulis sp.]|tara:strand:+ start:1569 stop:1802 length:234 start_codon:yes stop_codon:yes gene_type:complete
MIIKHEGRHLTATDRSALAQGIAKGWTEFVTPRKWYEMKAEPDRPGFYRVRLGSRSEGGFSRALIEWRPRVAKLPTP